MNISNVLRNAAALGGIATLNMRHSQCGNTRQGQTVRRDTCRQGSANPQRDHPKVNYAGTTFLIDPMLAKKGTYPGFEGRTTASRAADATGRGDEG